MTAVAPAGWNREQRAQALMPRRDELIVKVPKRIRAARRLGAGVLEQVVDDVIFEVAVQYRREINSAEELSRVFWDVAHKRVKRALAGRYDLVRARHSRADLAVLEEIGDDDTPERLTLERAEMHVALQFAALLEGDARDVFRAQYQWTGKGKLGAERIAKETGLELNRVRSAEIAIQDQFKRFTAIYAAGRLCGFLAPGIAALAAGESANRLEDAARVHLEVERCATCRADYTRQLRYLQSARFTGKVAQLLPAPAVLNERRRTGIGDMLA